MQKEATEGCRNSSLENQKPFLAGGLGLEEDCEEEPQSQLRSCASALHALPNMHLGLSASKCYRMIAQSVNTLGCGGAGGDQAGQAVKSLLSGA